MEVRFWMWEIKNVSFAGYGQQQYGMCQCELCIEN